MTSLGQTFGSKSQSYSGGKKVWHEVHAAYPVGGKIDLASYTDGTVIPAGSMVALDMSNHTAKIVAANAGSTELAKVNGLLWHDLYIDNKTATNAAATVAVVYSGEIYADRLDQAIPDTVLAKLPQIVAIREA